MTYEDKKKLDLASYSPEAQRVVDANGQEMPLQEKKDGKTNPRRLKIDALDQMELEDPDGLVAQLQAREKAPKTDGLIEEYLNLHNAFPAHRLAARFAARFLFRNDRIEDAISLVDGYFENLDSEDFDVGLARAELLADSLLYDAACKAYEDLIRDQPTLAKFRVAFAKRLRNAGQFERALEIVRPVASLLSTGSKAEKLWEDLNCAFDIMQENEVELGFENGDERIRLMCSLAFEWGRERSAENGSGLGKSVFITSNLAAAGAERQMTRLAKTLHSMAEGAEAKTLKIGGADVLVRSLNADEGHDFFMEDVLRAGCRVEQIEQGGARSATIPNYDFSERDEAMLQFLPSHARWGLRNICPILEARNYDTVSLWQDGTVLRGALAALKANVPNIQIVFRGMPTNIRSYLHKPEYGPLYRTMAKIPGVTFIANSQVAATAYEDWLGLEAGRIEVMHNGVEPPSAEPDKTTVSLHQAFEKKSGKGPLIGSVARFDTVKRPVDWVRTAAEIVKEVPEARFVMVGDGRLRPNCEDLVHRLGMTDKFLFTGHSKNVGYWLSSMDVVLMTSLFEGLPNALIEAQSYGVPVVSTPAGGAEESFEKGVTGILLDSLEPYDVAAAAKAVTNILAGQKDGLFGPDAAKSFVADRFSVSTSIKNYLRITVAQP